MEEGKRFSLLYLERGAPSRDSVRFRNRLASYFQDFSGGYKGAITTKAADMIHKETGAEVPYIAHVGYDFTAFFKKNEMRDVLDAITFIYQIVSRMAYGTDAISWKAFVRRAMQEENLGYKMDEKGGVHYFIDEEFERNRLSTLSALDDSKLGNVRDSYEAAYRHMDSDPPDGKAAVRSMFEALEILVRQMLPGTKNSNRWVVENKLKEKCLKLYESEPTGVIVTSALFDGFADWVDGLHNYRHGQPSEQPVAPKEEVAVYVLSSGSAFLRWLIGINADLTKHEKSA